MCKTRKEIVVHKSDWKVVKPHAPLPVRMSLTTMKLFHKGLKKGQKQESVTRVFVDKNGNLIEENGKSDKMKSDMKNSEIENKVILFKVKMK